MYRWLAVALAANYVLALITVTFVLRRRKEPMSMLAWVFAIITLPVVGMALYFAMGADRVRGKARRRRKRLRRLRERFEALTQTRVEDAVRETESRMPADLADVAKLGRRLTSLPVTSGNRVEVFTDANATYAALESAIRAAQHHVHLEYYIWQPDQTGTHFRDLLIEKARAGVKCRLLLDAVGCFSLRQKFTRPLIDAGVEVAYFLPLRPLSKRWSPHLRNHRKIVVIDGVDGFVGSQNIGDEYRGRLKKLSPWFDTHLRVRGPAALFLQETFVNDWHFTTRHEIGSDALFPRPPREGDSLTQILPTGPDQESPALTQILFAAAASAKESLRIETPYFVPDPAFLTALLHACYSGVKVTIVIPTRTDAPIVLWAGRSFYGELLNAGVEICEYDAGVLHSKLITIDDRWCIVGSANMDVRSFRLNFEITALVFDAAVTRGLAARIDAHAAASRKITPRDVFQTSWGRQVLEGASRLFAPLI